MSRQTVPNWSEDGLLQRLRSALPDLSGAQQRVVTSVLADPAMIVNLTVEAIAGQAGVSMPTVVRTCRSFGFDSVRNFMLALAQDLALSPHHLHRNVSLDDDAPEVSRKIIQGAISSLANLQRRLDVAVIDQAAVRLARASRIDTYSVGSTSAFMAQELQARLFRLGLRANAFADAHQQLISASSLDADGVAFVVSHVGSMPFMLEAAHLARSRGATVVALTQPDTPLAHCADLCLAVSVPQDTTMRVGTEAYLAHLLVIEILMVRIAQQLGPQTLERLRQFKQVLEQHGVDSSVYIGLY
ncbi:MAG: MurR/RpiR family transcriptional regulator [Castellaniella sp.]|uniref:MurR/RpiR family transcriptional regulator n=1 Tax=Castellaniella sp. TaxID=1955812 RepID=UPI00120F1E08|nr:MurR/RpiR family transcriptional regulator [Castellaniella sp.]TAN27161.1 MAG: MurR/RpiR family transcriptional regulator [Castellaniella sp.]